VNESTMNRMYRIRIGQWGIDSDPREED